MVFVFQLPSGHNKNELCSFLGKYFTIKIYLMILLRKTVVMAVHICNSIILGEWGRQITSLSPSWRTKQLVTSCFKIKSKNKNWDTAQCEGPAFYLQYKKTKEKEKAWEILAEEINKNGTCIPTHPRWRRPCLPFADTDLLSPDRNVCRTWDAHDWRDSREREASVRRCIQQPSALHARQGCARSFALTVKYCSKRQSTKGICFRCHRDL